jgi:hypothetical protein
LRGRAGVGGTARLHGDLLSRASTRSTAMNQTWSRYSYAWVTLGFFAISIAGHWLFGWLAYVDEQASLGQPVEVSSWFVEMMRDTLENWQSEFLQLLWQVGGLAILLYVGSPQSKEGDDRMEAKIDEILRKLDPQNAESIIKTLDDDYAGRHTDARHAHR